MIKAAKRAIFAILQNADINDELLTAFTGAESLINSRPLAYQTANPKDNVPLTPKTYFLIGQIGGWFAPEVDRDKLQSSEAMEKSSRIDRSFLE